MDGANTAIHAGTRDETAFAGKAKSSGSEASSEFSSFANQFLNHPSNSFCLLFAEERELNGPPAAIHFQPMWLLWIASLRVAPLHVRLAHAAGTDERDFG